MSLVTMYKSEHTEDLFSENFHKILHDLEFELKRGMRVKPSPTSNACVSSAQVVHTLMWLKTQSNTPLVQELLQELSEG